MTYTYMNLVYLFMTPLRHMEGVGGSNPSASTKMKIKTVCRPCGLFLFSQKIYTKHIDNICFY